MENIYYQLREQLDQYSVGFPATESGVEMKILKRLFTEEEAQMYLKMSLMPETAKEIAERVGEELEHIAALLEQMVHKGLIFRVRKGESAKYAASAFVVGIYEFQLKDMDRELARLFDEYMEEAFSTQMAENKVPMRTIPVNRAIDFSWPVLSYEDGREIIKSKDRIAVAKCICRVQQGLINKGCDKPLEVCFSFGSHAQYYVEKGLARWTSVHESLEILDLCEKEGLVPQPYNAQNPGGMCNCCGDCCGILRAIKKHPKPIEKVVSNYYAAVDSNLCVACETCLERCQMEAIQINEEDVAEVDNERCIGCGLCVTTCPSDAMTLNRKAQEKCQEPPVSAKDTMMEMTSKRGTSIFPLSVIRKSRG